MQSKIVRKVLKELPYESNKAVKAVEQKGLPMDSFVSCLQYGMCLPSRDLAQFAFHIAMQLDAFQKANGGFYPNDMEITQIAQAVMHSINIANNNEYVFTRALPLLQLITVNTINLSLFPFSAVHLEEFCEAMFTSNTLEGLHLPFDVPKESLILLFNSLPSGLKRLSCDWNNLEYSSPLDTLCTSMQSLPQLEYRSLYGNNLDCDAYKGMLGLPLLTLSNLHTLDLSFNKLDESCGKELALLLDGNHVLKRLLLRGNVLGITGVSDMFEPLKRDNNTLEELVLADNQLTDKVAVYLYLVIITNTTLRILDMSSNRLELTSMLCLWKGLLCAQHRTALVRLNVANNESSNTALQEARRVVRMMEVINAPRNVLVIRSAQEVSRLSARHPSSIRRLPQDLARVLLEMLPCEV